MRLSWWTTAAHWTSERSHCRNVSRVLVGIVAACLVHAASQTPSIVRDGNAFRVEGWNVPTNAPAGSWGKVLRISVGSADAPSVLGEHFLDKGRLTFKAKYPLSPTVTVHAVFSPPGGEPVRAVFEPAAPAIRPSVRVSSVYPSAYELPANLLKFYVHFSGPMSRGEAWDHLRLLDQDGQEVELPFLQLEQELWDTENQRLTVLFDPGRIKRGVLPREQIGEALSPGRLYTLEIGKSWRDAQGQHLVQGHAKKFRVRDEDRVPIEPASWKIKSPKAGTRDPLVVDLGEPLDHAMLARSLSVSGVPGAGSIDAGECVWRFTPQEIWKPGEYRLEVDSSLEDLAGNKVGRPFEVDVFEQVTKHVEKQTVSLPFRVGRQ